MHARRLVPRSRRITRWLVPTLSLLVAIAWLAPSPAGATVALRLSIEELVADSDLVVRGKVMDATSAWNVGKTAIYTETIVEVTEAFKGKAPATLTVRQLGGKVDGMEMDIDGNARLGKTEDVILFLKVEGKYAYVVGLAQGKFTVFKDAKGQDLVNRDLSGLAFMPSYSAPPGVVAFNPGGHEPAVPLADLKARIAQALAAPAGKEAR